MANLKINYTSMQHLANEIKLYVTNPGHDNPWILVSEKDFPYGTFFKVPGKKEEDHFYVGMMLTNLTSTTYRDWFFMKDNLDRYVVRHKDVLNLPMEKPYTTSGYSIYTYSPSNDPIPPGYIGGYRGWRRDNVSYNIFDSRGRQVFDITKHYSSDSAKSYGSYISFGVFKQFNSNLKWDEQGGAMNFRQHPIQFTQWYLRNSNQAYLGKAFYPPTMPGIGYPMLYTNTNLESPYNPNHREAWMIKDKYSMNVIIRNGKFWRTICVGMGSSYDDETYPFPAIQIGSMGLTPVGEDVPNGGSSNPVKGIALDLLDDNTSMCNSLPLFAPRAKSYANCPSSCAMMTPEGIWRFYSNSNQDVDIFYKSGVPDRHAFPLKKFVMDDPSGTYLHPSLNDIGEYAESLTYHDVDPHRNEYPIKGGYDITHTFIQSFLYHDFKINKDGNKPDRNTGVDTLLPRMYYANAEPKYYGEMTIDEDKYLLIPNIWKDRLPYYNYYLDSSQFGINSEFWETDRLLKNHDEMHQHSELYRMAIKLT